MKKKNSKKLNKTNWETIIHIKPSPELLKQIEEQKKLQFNMDKAYDLYIKDLKPWVAYTL